MAAAPDVLRRALGTEAELRDGQAEAIERVVAGGRLLLVQRTGWGKSIVYFTATALLRARGSGPTIVVSPLLSLMRDQQRSASRFGLACAHVDAKTDFTALVRELQDDRLDVIFTTPEQLAGSRLRDALSTLAADPGLIVVDEAHCISDWGHDFRPEYRRLARFLRGLDTGTPLLATTATANERVIADIAEQLGDTLAVQRGPLVRESLRLAAFSLPDHASRLAWLAQNVPLMNGSGVIYCLTTADCERVSSWLRDRGIDAPAYHAQFDDDRRVELEEALLANRVKALVSTVALGMGFDKPDLGFVVHYQAPASIVAYYQQVGRAGRALPSAHAVLLSGSEDAEIHDYFIRTAFPDESDIALVLSLFDGEGDGLTLDSVLARANITRRKAEQILHLLELDEHAVRDKRRFVRTAKPWQPDHERIAEVTARRRREFEQVQSLVGSTDCLMRSVTAALDDLADAPCGTCASCSPAAFSAEVDPGLEQEARRFLGRAHLVVEPRKQKPAGPREGRKNISPDLRCEEGRALCFLSDPGWGALVRAGRAGAAGYGDELVAAAVAMVEEWAPQPTPSWVSTVPASASPDHLADLARRIAATLGLPFVAALEKQPGSLPQRSQLNPAWRFANATAAYRLAAGPPSGPVLLVDGLVESGWTLAVCGMLLRGAGCEAVLPVVLARATAADG